MRVTALALVFGFVLPATAAAQNPAEPPQTYLIEYSTAPMVRHAAVAEILVRSIERGADWVADGVAGDLFTRKSTGGFFARLGRGVAFDFAVETFCLAIAHEYGHAARAEESGRSSEVFLGPSVDRRATALCSLPASPRRVAGTFLRIR